MAYLRVLESVDEATIEFLAFGSTILSFVERLCCCQGVIGLYSTWSRRLSPQRVGTLTPRREEVGLETA